MPGFPIRTSTDQSLFAAPRSFSQLTTSFVISESLGIPHTLLFASFSFRSLFAFNARVFSLLLLINLSMNFLDCL